VVDKHNKNEDGIEDYGNFIQHKTDVKLILIDIETACKGDNSMTKNN
jgi:hypothetical protein